VPLGRVEELGPPPRFLCERRRGVHPCAQQIARACLHVYLYARACLLVSALCCFPTRMLGMRVPLDQAQSLCTFIWLLVHLLFIACIRVRFICCIYVLFRFVFVGTLPHAEGLADTIYKSLVSVPAHRTQFLGAARELVGPTSCSSSSGSGSSSSSSSSSSSNNAAHARSLCIARSSLMPRTLGPCASHAVHAAHARSLCIARSSLMPRTLGPCASHAVL
jgi:hypothetical protein